MAEILCAFVKFPHEEENTTKKRFVRTPRLFSRGRSKFDLLLQMEQSYSSTRPALENAFLGADHTLTNPYK